MPIGPGAPLGPYEIVSRLGAGGMGEVYRARDTRLDRMVAIKVISSPLAADPELRERFEREARAVSSLDHPHICALYDVGEHEGTSYLVMQYLDGETLAERLRGGALPLEQTLTVAVQLASALDAAHRAGIVHRDLKPGNVMLTKAGAKLLDFGLAKSASRAVAAAGVTALPTEQTPMTAQGTLLGTWQYMAPEQIEGQEADARTDIFAFGLVLYEMVSGRRAFDGRTQASVLGAILHKEPPVLPADGSVPPALARMVRRCLAKDPDDRWQSARDLASELGALQAGNEPATTRPVSSHAPAQRRYWLASAFGMLALAMTGVAAYLAWRVTAAPPQVTRLAMPTAPADSVRNAAAAGTIIAISRDGRQVAFVGNAGTSRQLFVRAMDQDVATPLPGTQEALAPAFSPDGRWIAYSVTGALMKVEVTGGAPQVVCKNPGNVRGLAWLDDEWLAFGTQGGGLMRVRAAGAEPEPLTRLDSAAGELTHGFPSVHPSRPVVVFTTTAAGSSGTDGVVEALDLASNGRRRLMTAASGGRITQTGHLVFLRAGNIMAVPIDEQSLLPIGAPITAQPGVDTVGGPGNWDVAAEGTLAFITGAVGGGARRSLVWVEGGRTTSAIDLERAFEDPRVSPDGRFVAAEVNADGGDIWVTDLRRGTSTRLTFDPGEDETPAWSPDGQWVAWSADRAGQPRTVFRKRADGSGTDEKIWSTPAHLHVESWLPDGRGLLVMRQSDGQNDIWLVPIGGGDARPLLQGKHREYGARLSADMRWIAYTSNESGEDQVFVQPYPSLDAKWQISTAGGGQPVWSADGRTLYYRGEGALMAVEVEATARALSVSVPRKLADDAFSRKGDTHTGWDVARDGRLLLVRAGGEAGRPTFVNIVQHWLTDVVRRAQPDR